MALDQQALEAAASQTRNLSFDALTIGEHRDLSRRIVTAYIAALGDGWRLVPVEPTEAMIEAAGGPGAPNLKRKVWSAMLAAAPTPPGEKK